MAIPQLPEPKVKKPLRLWPGAVAAVLLLLVRFGLPVVYPAGKAVSLIGGIVGGLAILAWWLFFSRAPWFERLGAGVLMIAALFATSLILHESIATGAMGMLFPILAIPVLGLAFVGWAVATRRLSNGPRRAAMVATILLACGVWALIRTGGFTANFDNDFAWRWAPSPEERLLAEPVEEPLAPPAPETVATPENPPVVPDADKPKALPSAPTAVKATADWPGFRGSGRDSIIRGVRIETDWTASPPVALWRRALGPGWSSFAVRGDRVYTQEQRGDEEVVACYNLTTGKPIWMHRDTTRFWESNGGAGPRATPTLNSGRVYTFGATGILNALDAGNGAVVWSRNAAADASATVPDWGFSSSPLVVDDVVVVAVAGQLVGYDLATGSPRWFGPVNGGGYSSPHFMTVDGVAQIVLLSTAGATSVAPADGTVLWEHAWRGSAIVQPASTADGDILITTTTSTGGIGTRRLAVTHGAGGWTVEERWTSMGLKPYFNDFVVHNGHAFGFDGSILACIDLADGKRKWKGGRYGNGQLVLLRDQDVLLILSEDGELALVVATTDQFTELARIPAIDGKTWNHPVLVGDVLLIRNGQEMVAFRLSLQGL